MITTKTSAGFGVTLALLASCGAAQAATVDLAAFGSFQNISAGPEARYQTDNNDEITDSLLRWGDTNCSACAPYTSRLGFDGLGSTHKPRFSHIEVGSAFRIGELSLLNGTPGHYKTNVNYLDMLLSVRLGADDIGDFVFNLNIENTRDEYDAKRGDPDHLKLVQPFGTYHFSHAGQSFTLDFLGLSLDQGESFVDSLSVAEGNKIKAGLYALIGMSASLPPPSPQAVPIPAAAWLFGSGLLAMAGLGQRKRRSRS